MIINLTYLEFLMKIRASLIAPMSLLSLAIASHAQAADEAFQRSVEQRLAKLGAQQPQGTAPLAQNVTFSGLVEVEGYVGEAGDESYSDLVVATVELGLAAQINDKVSAEVIALYEESPGGEEGTELDIDVATISIANIIGPVNLDVGKMYVPFGRFETALVNDTLVLEAAETNKTAALFGMEQDGLSIGAYVFDGDADREQHVENYGVTLSFEQENFAVGLDYISALTESDALVEAAWDEHSPAFSLSGRVTLGEVNLLAEYLAATSELVLEGETEGFEPEVAHIEANIGVSLNEQPFSFAVAYQQTDDAAGYLPEERLSLGCSTDIYENVSLGLEYWHDEDYSETDGGSGEDSDNIVVQLAVSF